MPASSRHSPVSPAAFTLVELLAVIAITGVLIGILIVAVGRARVAAQASECRSNLHHYGAALWLYAADHQGQMVIHYRNNPNGGGTIGWAHDLRAYLAVNSRVNTRRLKRISYSCPAFEDETEAKYANDVAALGYYWNSSFNSVKMASLDPARSVAAWDQVMDNGWAGSAPNPTKGGGSQFAYRHGNLCNFLFVDGHVQAVAKGQYGDARDYADLRWKP